MCRDVKVRLCTRVSTCDLDLQLFGRAGRGAGTSCLSTISNSLTQRGKTYLLSLLPSPKYQGPSLGCCVSMGPGAGRPGSWPDPSRPRIWASSSWSRLYQLLESFSKTGEGASCPLLQQARVPPPLKLLLCQEPMLLISKPQHTFPPFLHRSPE